MFGIVSMAEKQRQRKEKEEGKKIGSMNWWKTNWLMKSSSS